jgi:hypothetical protein
MKKKIEINRYSTKHGIYLGVSILALIVWRYSTWTFGTWLLDKGVWGVMSIFPPLLISLGLLAWGAGDIKKLPDALKTLWISIKSDKKGGRLAVMFMVALAMVLSVTLGVYTEEITLNVMVVPFVVKRLFYGGATIIAFEAFLLINANYKKMNTAWIFLAVMAFCEYLVGAKPADFVLSMGYYAVFVFVFLANQKGFASGFAVLFDMVVTCNLVCLCNSFQVGAWKFETSSDVSQAATFLYAFIIGVLGVVAYRYGKRAYLMSMNRAELVDRGYVMVRNQHGVETPMLRATYQYNIMQAIKPWIAITEAGKKRRRGRVIMQELQKGWAFHEVFNAQGERLTHGFIDANMDLERMPESYLQDNRPKLAIAWELDTDALYYLRVEFEGETLYGALRMYSYEADHKRMAHDVSNRLYNTWIHPNEEEILTCTLYKASGEEVFVKSLYGKYHDS